jgi:uncharacterized heparinase superfamily protein
MLAGRDRFIFSGSSAPERDAVTIRFHLHPDIELFRDNEDRLVLAARQADHWVFTCNIPLRVEESIFFAALGGPRRSRQIVLGFRASRTPEVRWQFQKRRYEGELL